MQPWFALQVLNILLVFIGLWVLFPKCGVRRGWALVPYLRIIKLAQSADAEDVGIVWATASLVLDCLQLFFVLFPDFEISTWLAAAIIAMYAVILIYSIRTFFAVCRLLETKRRWLPVWLICEGIPMIVWGLSRKVSPALEKKAAAAAPLSGMEVDATDIGLTVNLKYRAVREFLRRKYLLRDIHLNIAPGRMVLLLGGSGAGKTTFINAVTGYEKAKAQILLNGENVYKEYDRMLYKIGVVPQQDLIRYDDTVIRTLSDAAVLRLPGNIGRKERNQRVREVLDIFGLTSVKNNEVQKLSGGQKKRLSIAMEFVSDPELFILDEPDSGLDGVLARDLMQRLRKIAESGKTVIVITHSPDRVKDLFDDVIVLAKDAKRTGRLVFFGTIGEAEQFFETDKMEQIVRIINRKDEGGEGRADELISRYMEVCNAGI